MIEQWNLMPWIIAWGIVTIIVLFLASYRLKIVSHEVTGVHVLEAPEVDEDQRVTARKLLRVDFAGKMLTVISALLIVVIGLIYGYQTYMKAYEVVGH